jgi:hypothetical protein
VSHIFNLNEMSLAISHPGYFTTYVCVGAGGFSFLFLSRWYMLDRSLEGPLYWSGHCGGTKISVPARNLTEISLTSSL